MERERTGSFPAVVSARLQELTGGINERGKRTIATSGLDELSMGV
jgi:hypothetical protein